MQSYESSVSLGIGGYTDTAPLLWRMRLRSQSYCGLACSDGIFSHRKNFSPAINNPFNPPINAPNNNGGKRFNNSVQLNACGKWARGNVTTIPEIKPDNNAFTNLLPVTSNLCLSIKYRLRNKSYHELSSSNSFLGLKNLCRLQSGQ